MLRWSVLSVLLLVAAPDVSKEAIRKLARELSPDVPVEWQGRLESVLLYHFRSKHFLDVQASLPGELDWSSQPSPWRSYDGAPSVRLPCSLAPLEAALRPVPLSRESLGAFLRLGAGLSAWKSYDGLHMWALRVMPSSGNLQTTEFHVVLPPLDGLAGVPASYHFQPEMHALEFRLSAPHEFVTTTDGSAGFLVVLTTLCIREAWKYGERALRSCHLNLGHAVAALDAACGLFGWSLEEGPPALRAESILGTVLGLPAAAAARAEERERPELALFVRTAPRVSEAASAWPAYLTPENIQNLYWDMQIEALGVPRALRPQSPATAAHWPAMDAAEAGATMASEEADAPWRPMEHLSLHHLLGDGLMQAILGRRSVLKMSEQQPVLPEKDFLLMLRAACASVPEPRATWRGAGRSQVHILLMVHNVESFLQGLYVLTRPSSLEEVRELFNTVQTTPQRVKHSESGRALGLPEGCGMWSLASPVDVRHAAQLSGCGQEVAGAGSFAAAFFGSFVAWHHPRTYLELLWHAGALGHVLYLAAEAAGYGATGMGCFMDDMALSLLRDPWSMEGKGASSSQTFSLEDSQLQVLYYLTVGKPQPDPRLLSFEPYQHLQEGFSYEALQGGMGRIFQT